MALASQPEAADRILERKLNEIVADWPGPSTTLVLITEDLDFAAALRAARERSECSLVLVTSQSPNTDLSPMDKHAGAVVRLACLSSMAGVPLWV